MKPFKKLKSVRALDGTRLEVALTGDRKVYTIDIAPWIDGVPMLAPLRDPEVFRTARVAYWGGGVAWGEVMDEEDGGGPIDMSGEQLWRLIAEEQGEIMPTAAFRTWRRRNDLSLTRAAEVLGLSRRMVGYYDSGAWPVPKTVMLATAGYEALREREAA